MLSIAYLDTLLVVKTSQLCSACLFNICGSDKPPYATTYTIDHNYKQTIDNRIAQTEEEKAIYSLQKFSVRLDREELRWGELTLSIYPTFIDGYNLSNYLLTIQRVPNGNIVSAFAARPIPTGTAICTFNGKAMEYNTWQLHFGKIDIHRKFTYIKEEFNQIIAMDATEPREEYGYGRFINHSTQRTNVRVMPVVHNDNKSYLLPATEQNMRSSVVRLVFYAIVDIPQGDEVLVNFLDSSNQSKPDDPWMLLS